MKKRAGFIVIPWEDGAVDYRPVDPDTKAIPNAGWIGEEGAIVEWMERPEDDAAASEWWEAQDALDESAKAVGKSSGGRKRAEQKRSEAEKIEAWLWPLFEEAHAHLAEEGAKRIGQKRLVEETRLWLDSNDPRKSKVTRTRAENWLANRRKPYK